MKVLINKKTKSLFVSIIMIIIFSTLIVTILSKYSATYVFIISTIAGLSILTVIYLYLVEQNKILEDAISQIKKHLSGKTEEYIKSDEEGELYRLFHEVNNLVSILNAHSDNAKNEKTFLRDTISDISHQLKTPLAALNIYNGIIYEETKELDVIQEFSKLSENELDRIESIVQNLLNIAKFDAGTIGINRKIENLSELFAQIEMHFSYRATSEGKSFILLGEDDLFLNCDRAWMFEAISNIVKNSFDHTKASEEIVIKWSQKNSIIQITITDNGSGIHQEDIHHIFKRFYRSRFSKDERGVGLGLSLSKTIIEEHNGTIEVDSQLGIGTTFTINFAIPTDL